MWGRRGSTCDYDADASAITPLIVGYWLQAVFTCLQLRSLTFTCIAKHNDAEVISRSIDIWGTQLVSVTRCSRTGVVVDGASENFIVLTHHSSVASLDPWN